MSDTYKRRYGVDWPKDAPDHLIELHMWKKHKEYPYSKAELLNPVSEHVLRAIRLLFTEDQVKIHPWLEQQAYSWTYDDFSIWWGCAGSGKSQSLGLFTLLDYIPDPDQTFSLLASTTKDMLLLRSYSSVTQHLGYLKANRKFHIPFKYIAQSTSVVPEGLSEEEMLNLKCRIKGVAVAQGTEQEARANLQGVHVKYVRLVLDELEGMRSAAMEARHNLAQCEDFKLFGACNPESWTGLAGKFSVPTDGIASVNTDSEKWKTEWGTVLRFDAFKSPGILEPKKYPFLPNQGTIDRIIKANAGNTDAPAVWTFLRAFPPAQGAERTVLTPQMIETYSMKTPVASWMSRPVKLAAVDPAFTSDGDKAMIVVGELGMASSGTIVLNCIRKEQLKIEASSKVPVTQQLVEQVAKICGPRTDDNPDGEDVPHENIGFDDSGNQSVADAYEMYIGRHGVYRCNFAERPPEIPVSAVNPQPASQRYKNVVTWLYYNILELGQRGQIRGLFEDAADQFCKRRLGEKQKPLMLETKKDYKKRLHEGSPDDADACAILAGLARERLGLVPGASEFFPNGVAFDHAEIDNSMFMMKVNNLTTKYGQARRI